ncbi:MAG: hypothetical protein IKA36_00045 [Clostridia bacterium]|nr:hypothetical protein [Clostridia bacterium]
MLRPDPNASRIRDIFSQTFANTKKPDELEQLKYVGEQMFRPEEVNATNHQLDRLLRQYFVDNHISEEYFAEKFKLYALKELGMHPTQASNNRSNLTKALKAGHITFRRFLEVICMVLGNTIDSMTFVITDDDGKSQTLSCAETNDKVNNKVKSTVSFKGE